MTNLAPIVLPKGIYRVHGYDDIYGIGSGQIVPNKGDRVDKFNGDSTYTSYYVADVKDYVATLSLVTPANNTINIADFLNAGVEPFTLYYDTKVSPYTIKVDSAFTISEASASYAKIFSGTDTTSTGTVISQMYDSAGSYASNLIPLDLSSVSGNVTQRYVRKAYTTANLSQNQPMTLVVYDSAGTVIAIRSLRVQHTNMISGLVSNSKTVLGIGLKSIYPGMASNNTLMYPSNLAYSPSNFKGIVYYADNTSTELPIDGVIFNLEGLDGYIPNSASASYDIVLKYVLQSNESGCGNNMYANVFQAKYTLQTTAPNTSYTVRLYAYPVWQNSSVGYGLKWFLCDYNRDMSIDVTSLITVKSGSFNGLSYGINQTLTVSINLNSANAALSSYNYIQSVKIFLVNPGTYRTSVGNAPNWYVYNDGNLTVPYGSGLFSTFVASAGNSLVINLAGLYTDKVSWLNAIYNAINPIKTAAGGIMPPTHFSITVNGTVYTYPIDYWNQTLNLIGTLTNSDTLFITFINQSATNYSILLTAGIPLYQKNTAGNYI